MIDKMHSVHSRARNPVVWDSEHEETAEPDWGLVISLATSFQLSADKGEWLESKSADTQSAEIS